MSSFIWDSCYVTGLKDVDDQHHRLVDVINQFGDLLMRREGASDTDLERVFAELATYADYHFREEESLMAHSPIDVRHIERHREEHANFLAEVTRMHAGLDQSNIESAESLLRFLTYWLAYHILGSDQVMARQMVAIEAGMSPDEAYQRSQSHDDPATGALLHALNGLFHQVSDRNRALFELNQTLEAKVQERTHELYEANLRLETLAMTDVLTGLPNRRHALYRFAIAWQESLENSTPVSCMMIDADGFKQINDSQGHEAGDEVLRSLSRQLRESLRTDDCVCRLGGDEFLVICPHTPLEGALKIAESLRQQVSRLKVPAGSGEWRGSVSIGVAARTQEMAGFEELMRTADQGVYAAKRRGRNCVATVSLD